MIASWKRYKGAFEKVSLEAKRMNAQEIQRVKCCREDDWLRKSLGAVAQSMGAKHQGASTTEELTTKFQKKW